MRARDFRSNARAALKGNWFIAIITTFVASLLGGINGSGGYLNYDFTYETDTNVEEGVQQLSHIESLKTGDLEGFIIAFLAILGISFVIALLVSLIIGSGVSIGYAKFNLDMVDGYKPRFKELFGHFGQTKTAIAVRIKVFFRVLIGLIFFIVPGVIAAYKYSMVYYVMAEHPGLRSGEVLRESARIMKGNKWKLFCLSLSFIGWSIVAALTVVGIYILLPYQQAAFASFYRSIKRRSYLY